MKKSLVFQWIMSFVLLLLLAGGCKSEFEKVRISGDSKLIQQKAFEYYEAGQYVRAQALLELLIPAFRGQKDLEKIYFTYAYTYFYDKKFLLASYYFKNFATTFPNSPLREEAEFMSAFSNYQLSPSYRLDQTNTEKAIEEFQLFINTFPESERVKDANNYIDLARAKLEQKAFSEAELYFDLRQYQASVLSYENLLKDFPETKRSEETRYKIAKASFLLAENSVLEKQPERYQAVQKQTKEFLNKYPSSPYREEIASMYDKSSKQLKTLENERYQNKSTGS